MPSFEIEDLYLKVEIQHDIGSVTLLTPGLAPLLSEMVDLAYLSLIDSVELVRQTITPFPRYTYEIRFVDGRLWKQTLTMAGQGHSDTLLTFEVTDGFTYPLLVHLIAIRRFLDPLLRTFQISSLEVIRKA